MCHDCAGLGTIVSKYPECEKQLLHKPDGGELLKHACPLQIQSIKREKRNEKLDKMRGSFTFVANEPASVLVFTQKVFKK